MKLFRAEVLDRRLVTAGMVRVRLGGTELANFSSTGVGDEYVRLFFPDAAGELVTPEIDERGFWKYPEGKTPSHCECYTVRNWDAATHQLDIDFVVHEGGIASDWAQRANPGDWIVMNEPHPIYEAPPEAALQIFLCDATGLPALGRLLEQLPAGSSARAVVEIPDAGHQQKLTSNGELIVTWLEGSGNGVGPSRLPETLRAMDLPEGSYVWAASEQKTVRPIRKYLRHELRWPASRYSVTGYWTDKLADWERGWAALDDGLKQKMDDAWASDRDREEVADEVEATMEKYGL